MKSLHTVFLLFFTLLSTQAFSAIIFETSTDGGFTTRRTTNAYITWLKSDTTQIIDSFSLYGNAETSTDLQFLVFKLDGTRLLNLSSSTSATNGLEWINSGNFNLTLEAGIEYGFGAQSVNRVGWYADQTGSSYNGFTSFTHPNSNTSASDSFGNGILRVDAYNCCDGGIRLYANTVPEPSVIALMSLGLFGLSLSRRKLKK